MLASAIIKVFGAVRAGRSGQSPRRIVIPANLYIRPKGTVNTKRALPLRSIRQPGSKNDVTLKEKRGTPSCLRIEDK